jgi:hypothetical protein
MRTLFAAICKPRGQKCRAVKKIKTGKKFNSYSQTLKTRNTRKVLPIYQHYSNPKVYEKWGVG